MGEELLHLLIIYSGAGYVAHACRSFTVDLLSESRRELGKYAMGILCVLPLGSYMFASLKNDIRSSFVRFIVTYTLSFVSFGVGVFLGHLYDSR